MDWSKAKNILILVFILLNIFLLCAISFYKLDQGISRETISSTVQILGERGVLVKCEIPAYKKDMPALLNENGGIDREVIASVLLGEASINENSLAYDAELISGSRKLVFKNDSTFEFFDISPTEKNKYDSSNYMESYIRKLINNLGFKASSYRLDKYHRNITGVSSFVFIETYKKFPVYDNRIEVEVARDGITYMKVKHKKIKGFTNYTMPIMPAYQVMLKNYNVNSDIQITHIDIGFKGFITQEQNMKELSEGPAWRIITSEGKERYFKASDGEEIN